MIPAEGLLCGRSHMAGLHFSEPDVSGHHVQFYFDQAGRLVLHNLSLRKTLVNGKKTENNAVCILNGGEEIQLGASIRMKLVCDDEKDQIGHELTNETEFVEDLEEESNSQRKHALGDEETVLEEEENALDDEETILEEGHSLNDEETVLDDGGDSNNGLEKKIDDKTNDEDGSEEKTVLYERIDDSTSYNEATRTAGIDEIERIRKLQKRTKERKIVIYSVLVIILFGMLAAGWYFSSLKQEAYLSWPVDKKGKYNDETVCPNTEMGDNFGIYFPRCNDLKHTQTDNGFIVETRLGKMYDVPFRIIYTERKSTENLMMTRRQGIERWRNETFQREKGWNFDMVSDVEFRGKDNGLPYQYVKYTRSDNGRSWFGVAIYFKFRAWEIVFCKEIPSKERWRGETLLLTDTCFYVSQYLIERHWEYQGRLLEEPVNALMNEARTMLDRTAPRLWPQIMDILVSVVIRSYKENDTDTFNQAERMLHELRRNQTLWLNSQKIEYFNAFAKNLHKEAKRIRDDCRSMFSDENDQRYHFIRKDQWE